MPHEPTGAVPEPSPAPSELAATPPFLSWRALYLVVLAALAVELAGLTALTLCFR
jgi:hypothetical protein